MRAHGHTLSAAAGTGLACWALGSPPPVTLAATALAGGWALWPDLDTQGTAARSLGWATRLPAYGLAATGRHRGWTHTLLAQALLALGLLLVIAADPAEVGHIVALGVVFAGLVWFEAGMAADDKPAKRLGAVGRVLAAGLGTAAVTHWCALAWWGLAWVPAAVLAGGVAHLAGDVLTTDQFPALAPFTRREFGGLRFIPPTPRGQRVTWQERALEGLCWALVLLVLWQSVWAPLAAVCAAWTAVTWLRRQWRLLLRCAVHPVWAARQARARLAMARRWRRLARAY